MMTYSFNQLAWHKSRFAAVVRKTPQIWSDFFRRLISFS
jgi:hypothetical protein